MKADNFKTKSIVFNLDNPEHKELYEFCMERCGAKRRPDGSYKGGNFSSFAINVLFLYKNWVKSGKIEEKSAFRRGWDGGKMPELRDF